MLAETVATAGTTGRVIAGVGAGDGESCEENESFGLAALEAMACRVPPVATRVGGVPELVTHGVDGFLEQPGDVEAQSARVLELLTDAALHERIANAARNTALTRFDTERIIPQYVSYYEEIIAQQ